MTLRARQTTCARTLTQSSVPNKLEHGPNEDIPRLTELRSGKRPQRGPAVPYTLDGASGTPNDLQFLNLCRLLPHRSLTLRDAFSLAGQEG